MGVSEGEEGEWDVEQISDREAMRGKQGCGWEKRLSTQMIKLEFLGFFGAGNRQEHLLNRESGGGAGDRASQEEGGEQMWPRKEGTGYDVEGGVRSVANI